MQEELLVQSMSRGFKTGLGLGLDAWAKMVPQQEWGRIRAMQEEALEEGDE